MTQQKMSDFPKIGCPFIRKMYEVNKDDFKKYGCRYRLREPRVYLVTDEVHEGFEWVFDDEDTIAVEKLDGTNVKVKTEDGKVVAIQNRKNIIEPMSLKGGVNPYIVEGILKSIKKGYIRDNSEQFGEVIGEKFQGNPYKIDGHLWYPFERAIISLKYSSLYIYPHNFRYLSAFLKEIPSIFHSRRVGKKNAIKAEGVVFYNLKRKAEGKVYMAKLRRDMFDWFYSENPVYPNEVIRIIK